MTTIAFRPKGEVAEWQMILPLVSGKPYGHVITFDQFEEALGRPLGSNRQPIYRALKELESREHRTLIPVRGEGYRVAHPREHEGLVRDRHRRSRRQLRKAIRTANATDETQLTTDERRTLQELKTRTSRLEQAARASDERLARLETVTQKQEQRVDVTEDRLSRIERALKLAA